MRLIQRSKQTDIRKRLSACQKDLVALEKDTVLLADVLAGLAAGGTARLSDQARRGFDRASRGIFAGISRKPRRQWRSAFRPVAIAVFSIASAALFGALLARR